MFLPPWTTRWSRTSPPGGICQRRTTKLGSTPPADDVRQATQAQGVDDSGFYLEGGLGTREAVCQNLDRGLRSGGPNRADRPGHLALFGIVEMGQRTRALPLADVEDRAVQRIHVEVDVVAELARNGPRDLVEDVDLGHFRPEVECPA